MTVTVADTTFYEVFYDAGADVLYLHVGDPATAVDFDATPEGHALRFDGSGGFVGLTIVGARGLLNGDADVTVTIPVRVGVSRDQLAAALAG